MAEQCGHASHKAVNDALREWRQGDCVVGECWFAHRLSPESPLTPEAEEAAREGVELVESQVRGFAIVTQTCDVVRLCCKRPFVELAALVEVNETVLRDVERGRRPRYAFIPGVAKECLVADLDHIMTVEKPVIAKQARVSGCATDAEIRALATALARKRQRCAFPDDFTTLVDGLQVRLQEKHDKQTDEGKALRALQQIRVRAAPSWGAQEIELMIFFIRDESAPDFQGKRWDELLEAWLKLIPPSGRYKSVDGLVKALEDLTAKDYVESDPLDLDHLSESTS